jgi:hypothetical protein
MRWRDNPNGCIIAVSTPSSRDSLPGNLVQGTMGAVALVHDFVPNVPA